MNKFLFIFLLFPFYVYSSPFLLNLELNKDFDIKVQSWKEQKDKQVIKQQFDYSCGASSLATILNYFYNYSITELEILQIMALDNMMASFADLAKASEYYGFVAKGFISDYDSLAQLNVPVIVYLHHKRNDHFSVVRAIDGNRVYLADSSWGNRILTRRQFEEMWYTDKDNKQGRMLLILPKEGMQKNMYNSFFGDFEDNQILLQEIPLLLHKFL